MIHNWRYLKYVLRHKYFVYQEGRKLGVPVLNLILHDWDKFTPAMWRAYSNKFYNYKNLISEERAHQIAMVQLGIRFYTKEQCDLEFNQTWRRHQHRNKHHWQEAERKDDNGVIEVMEMAEVDAREMVADWRGASRAIPNAKPLPVWYGETKAARKLHPATLRLVEDLLGIEVEHE